MREICGFELRIGGSLFGKPNLVGTVKQKYTFYEMRVTSEIVEYERKFYRKKEAVLDLIRELGTVQIVTSTLPGLRKDYSEETHSVFRNVTLFNNNETSYRGSDDYRYILFRSSVHQDKKAEIIFQVHKDEQYAYDMVCNFYKMMEYVKEHRDIAVEYCGNIISYSDEGIEITNVSSD